MGLRYVRLRNQTAALGHFVSCTKRDPRGPLLAEQNIASFLERGGASSDPAKKLAEKLVSFLRDGATVNGTQRSSKTPNPQRGANLAYVFAENSSDPLQKKACSHVGAGSHRIDLCAKKLEDRENVQRVLRTVYLGYPLTLLQARPRKAT